MQDQQQSQLEQEKLRWEIISLRQNARWDRWVSRAVSMLGPALVFVGLVIGTKQYADAKEKEFRKVLWERQLDVYQRLAESASKLVAPGDTAGHAEALRQFNVLYHGPLLVVADSASAYRVKEFYSAYLSYRHDGDKQIAAQNSARSMAASFRDALRTTWNAPLKRVDPSTFRIE